MKYKNNKQNKYINISYHIPKSCPYCKSKDIVKYGYRFNHTKKKQRWKCKTCFKLWVVDDGFKKVKTSRELITCCLDLYMNGMSLRKIANHINQFSQEKISYRSILNWIIRFSFQLKDFQQNFNLNLSGQYHADEIFIKCKNEQHYFFDMIDKGTRVLLSSVYSKKRDYQSARMLFLKAKHKPLNLFTDGLQAYSKAFRKVWGSATRKQDGETYIRLKADTDKRNNIIERVQGTIRDRIKIMRSFKNPKSAEAILSLFVVWYNFVRVHSGINCTPIEKAGIDLQLGENKWLDLIYRGRGL